MTGAIARLAMTLIGAAIVGGCSHLAPPYAPSTENVELLKSSGAGKAKVGKFSVPEGLNRIQIRATTMTSPVEGSFGAYLADAIRQEFSLAKLLDPDSNVEISGALVKNDVETGVAIHGSTVIEAHVLVKKNGEVRFDKVESATYEFDSNFIGAIAIPRGIQSYPPTVQKFLATLYADSEFIAALK